MESLYGGDLPPAGGGYAYVGEQKVRASPRESDLDRMQSALEKADHPKQQNNNGIPMSQLFDLDAFVRELDSPNALDALRRHSGQAPQQSQLLQSTLGEPLTAPQLSPYNTMQSVPIAQQQAYLQQQANMMTPGLLQNYSTAHTTHMLGQPQLAQPPSLGAYHQQPMLATSQILAQQPMAQSIPEFTFNPATPSPMIGDMQQAGPTFSTLLRDATALAEMSMVDPNSLQGGLQPTSHQPAQKTLSAIVRELVNDDSIIPPSTHPSNNTGLHF